MRLTSARRPEAAPTEEEGEQRHALPPSLHAPATAAATPAACRRHCLAQGVVVQRCLHGCLVAWAAGRFGVGPPIGDDV